MDEYTREPCPWRIFDDAGGAFCMGAIGGGLFHFVKGVRNAPKGVGNRLFEGANYVRVRAPITGGAFAMWGFTFSSIDCSMVAIRRKEDPFNSIFSGFATGFILAIRSGLPAALGQGVVGGIILGLIEGMMVWMNKMGDAQFEPVHVLQQEEHMKKQQQQMEEFDKMNFTERLSHWWNQKDNQPVNSASVSGPINYATASTSH
ncbi:mitochondrial import inner membrane translocase subunit Tim17-A-like [Symsagittifera roscoffensis]|uniref:mitochondrial import inner membrane translocase subunit Tim17-A-like n=1 Tax=Symsagittifera roscoffensis TaxID=84072 RepID=UPI00307BE5E3